MGVSDLPEPESGRAPRYSLRALPRYRYVPGVRPHPLRDPAGHSYEPRPMTRRHPSWSPEDWRRLDVWLYGVDLYNQFYFWEAHEAWEELWASSERGEAPGLVLQGLIQVAAGLLKTHMAVIGGAQVLSAQGIDKLRRAATQHEKLMGLDLTKTISELTSYFAPLAYGELPKIDASVPPLRLEWP